MGKFKVLIVGANFNNKGAQSMLFITVDELKRRVPDSEIYYAGCDVFDDKTYSFYELYYSDEARKIALNENNAFLATKCWVKDCVKFVIGRRNNLFRYNEVKNTIVSIDLIIDVSGFNLGKKWSIEIQESYLNNIRLAKKYNIPIIMMPQSFGSFDYPKDKEFLLPVIRELLKYPKVIFAREKEGYDMLAEQFGLTNVQLSTDLVLQNNGVDLSNIYKKPLKKMNLPRVEAGSVAIIPNTQCFNHGDKEKNIQMYKDIIFYLIEKEKTVYIFRHSREDFPICKLIAEQFDSKKVRLLDDEFSCIEYDEFVKQFDFVICSRFHGIVHAYRNYIPCILLGWAIKYKELAANVGQKQFAFDITEDSFNGMHVKEAIDVLLSSEEKEAEIIKEHVSEIQKNNCFDKIAGYLV
jgi:polysaccharide pyruvyl transferase WcaK-like protein